MQKLARYWATDYNWRKVEAKLNALPQFITEIDGVDIHFIHVRSKLPNALPVIVTHGWPGSIIEQLKIIDPLTNPTAHGGSASDAFDVVIPSLPGYGFSGKPTSTGWDPIRIARAWIVLMKRLGYTRYVAQGGDWGNAVTEQMALLAPPELIGIHTNMPATVPADIDTAALAGAPAPSGLSADERHAYDQLAFFYKHGLGYAKEMANRPQTLYAIGDSPVGLAAWMLDHDARSLALIVARLRRTVRGPDARRRPRQRHALLADEHGGLVGPSVLGKQAGVFCPEERPHPGRRQRFSRGALSGAAELDGEGLSQAHLLQQARQGRSLRGVGAAGTLYGRTPCRLPFTAGPRRNPPQERDEVANDIDHDRRRFLGSAAMTIAAAHLRHVGQAVEASQRAPRELAAIGSAAEWLNSPRLTPDSLAGKVVLVDFWTYTCINWLRTASVRSRVGGEVPPRARRHRRAHTRVPVRTQHRQRAPCRAADADRVSGCDRQRLLHLAGVQ